MDFRSTLSLVWCTVSDANSLEIGYIRNYVDDLLISGSSAKLIDEFKLDMMQVFEMTDLGLMTYFLGMEIKQGKDQVFICQRKYAKEILK